MFYFQATYNEEKEIVLAKILLHFFVMYRVGGE
jgi:hypothetical protein